MSPLRVMQCATAPLQPLVDFAASPPRGPLRRFSVQSVHSRPCTEAHAIGPLVPPRESCSVHVVSLHRDGFLRTYGANIVAARSRPWGSSCCPWPPTCPVAPERAVGQRARPRFPRCTHPAKMLPANSAFLAHRSVRRRCVHARPLPPCRLHGRHRCRTLLPRGFERSVGVFSPRVRLRGFVPLAGLSPPFAVSSDRWLCPSMGFSSSFGRR